MRPFVDAASDLAWNPSDGFLRIVRMAILRKQFDSLEVISKLVAEEKGYAAGPLLRPACEELIWIKYLASVAPDDAEEVVNCVGTTEIRESLLKQHNFGGPSASTILGLTPFVEQATSGQDAVNLRLRILGKRLNWPARSVANARLPSVFWLARQTGEERTYAFLYHATSRFVHFSATELLRRAWGRPGNVSVRSAHFRDYWGAFSLCWGVRLFLDSAIELCEASGMPETGLDKASLLAAAKRIGEFGQVPIITAEELAWPS
jgi:hypothetical protein